MSNFQPLEVVGRGSETQFQVVENLNILTYRINNVNNSLTLKIAVIGNEMCV